jgi:hypothetical protein
MDKKYIRLKSTELSELWDELMHYRDCNIMLSKSQYDLIINYAMGNIYGFNSISPKLFGNYLYIEEEKKLTEFEEFKLENKKAFEEFRLEMRNLIKLEVLAEMQNLKISLKK